MGLEVIIAANIHLLKRSSGLNARVIDLLKLLMNYFLSF